MMRPIKGPVLSRFDIEMCFVIQCYMVLSVSQGNNQEEFLKECSVYNVFLSFYSSSFIVKSSL